MSIEITEKIIKRLPEFYRARERDSLFYTIVNAFAKSIMEQQKDLFSVMKSHWVDTAYGLDLDLLGSLLRLKRKSNEKDADFRIRIKSTVANFKGGGTVEAVKTQLALYLAIAKDQIVLIENPPVPMTVEKTVRSGDAWQMSSVSVNHEQIMVVLAIGEGEAREPTLTDSDNNFSIKYNGTIKSGETLIIKDGKAELDGVDVSSNVSFNPIAKPMVSRKDSRWIYRERLSDTLGRFNQAKFNEHVFYKPIPPTTIRFEWTAHMLAAFEVKVPLSVLERDNISKQEVVELVNAIKAAGVKAFVTFVE